MEKICYSETISTYFAIYDSYHVREQKMGTQSGERISFDGIQYSMQSMDTPEDKDIEELFKVVEEESKKLLSLSGDCTIQHQFQKRFIEVNEKVSESSLIHLIEIRNSGNRNLFTNYYTKDLKLDMAVIRDSVSRLQELAKDDQTAREESNQWPAIILDSEVAGAFISMLIGYLFEGNRTASKTSYFFNHIERYDPQIPITIHDTLKEFYPVDYSFDHEGTPAVKDIKLIEAGEVKSHLTDLESSSKLNIKNNGRARSQDYRNIPSPRATNVVVETGEITLAQMLADTKDGIYCVGMSGAAIDAASGIIHLNCQIGYRIVNGAKVYSVKEPGLSFEVFDFMNSICSLGNDESIGYRLMGKGRPLQNCLIGFRSPSIKLERRNANGS
jgi:predicted Zn-dependent protease